MKQVRSMFLLLFAMCPLCFLHAETYLTTGMLGGETGSVVDVPVFFSSDEDVVGAEFIIEYNASLLEIGGIQTGDALSDHEIFDDQETDGQLKLTILSMKNASLDEGNLSIVSFTLLADLETSQEHLKIDPDNTLLVALSGEQFSYQNIDPIEEILMVYNAALMPTKPAAGREILLEVNSDFPLTSYHWELGDGTEYNGTSTYHTYENPNNYLVTITAKNPIGTFTQTQEIVVNSPYWEFDAMDLGNGWKSFDWFGTFYDGSGNSWIYHQSLGWMYRHGETIDDTWLWSERWNWSWVSNEVFPYFAKANGGWIYYFNGTTNPIRWYDYSTENWYSEK
jgi:hypothetical protein